MSSRESYCKNPIAATAARLAELRATTLRSNNSRAGFQLLLTLTLNDMLNQPKNTTKNKKVTKICEFRINFFEKKFCHSVGSVL
jgi:hypothetical protein